MPHQRGHALHAGRVPQLHSGVVRRRGQHITRGRAVADVEDGFLVTRGAVELLLAAADVEHADGAIHEGAQGLLCPAHEGHRVEARPRHSNAVLRVLLRHVPHLDDTAAAIDAREASRCPLHPRQ